MTTTTLSSNKHNTAFRQCFTRLKGFILLYSSLIFICVPITTLLNYDKIAKYINTELLNGNNAKIVSITDIFTFFDLFAEIFIATVLPVFMAIFVFRYLHNKNAIDFYHSLPVSRTCLLFCNFASGYLSIALPFIISYTAKVAIIFSKIKQFSVISLGLENILIFSVIIFIVYSFCTLVAVSVGTTLECFGYSLAVCGALSVIGFITTSLCDNLFGFARQLVFTSNCFKLSPFGLVVTYVQNIEEKAQLAPITVWIVLAIVALLAANYIYKKRKSEISDVAGRKNPLSVIIRFIGAFCGGVMLLMLFQIDSNISFIACAVGGFLGYIIVEVIFAKGFVTVKKSIILSIVSAVVMGAYGLFFQVGGFGFEKRIPEFADIKSVTISQVGVYDFPFINEVSDKIFGDIPINYTLKEDESKQAVLDIHKLIVDHYYEYNNKNNNNNNINYEFIDGGEFAITYKLQNGKTIARKYYLYDNTKIQKAVAKLYDINEVKKAGTFVFHTTSDIVDGVSIANKIGSHSEKLTLSNAEIDDLLKALQKDTLNKNYNSIVNNTSKDYGTLTFSIINKNAKRVDDRIITRSIIVSENDVNTIGVLKEIKAYDIFFKGYNDVVSINLFAGDGGYQKDLIQCNNYLNNYKNEYVPQHSITIENPDIVKEIIDKSELYCVCDDKLENSSVAFVANFENGYSYTGFLRIKDIPLSIFENGKTYYKPKDKDIDALIDILIKTREYSSNISYIVDLYKQQQNNQSSEVTEDSTLIRKNAIINSNIKIEDSNYDELYSTPSVYLYYLKNTIK